MIPKKIHYIWFGGKKLPKLATKCIASWKKYMPEYEIIRWDESNFDVNLISYTRDAFTCKKWAFVSDYARFWILYNYGGVYFDTDVEIIKPMDDILYRGAYLGIECGDPNEGISVNPGLGMAMEPGNYMLLEILKFYETLQFTPELIGTKDMKTIVYYTTKYLYSKGLQNKNDLQYVEGIYIYPKSYFCPSLLNMQLTTETHSIHHYECSWNTKFGLFKKHIYKFFILDNKTASFFYYHFKKIFSFISH